MPAAYPNEVREFIWLMLVGRISRKETLRRLSQGEAGRAVVMPVSSYQHIARQLKLERGDPRDYVPPDADQTPTIALLKAEAVGMYSRTIRELQQKQRRSDKPLSQADINTLNSAVKGLTTLEGEVKNTREQERAKAKHSSAQSFLERLSRQERDPAPATRPIDTGMTHSIVPATTDEAGADARDVAVHDDVQGATPT